MYKNIKIALFVIASMIASGISAQNDDPDWQIGGGRVETESDISETPRRDNRDYNYSYDNYNGVSLWKGGYEQDNVALVIGYVSKQWYSEYANGVKRSENFFGEKNKRLHGLQIGLQAGHTFDYGLGLQTGLYYEAYFSSSQYVVEKVGYDNFTESDLYIPAHVLFRIPFTPTYGLSLYGGIAWQWAISGEFRENGHTYYDYDGNSHYLGPKEYQHYGNGWPKHSNWQLEAGFKLRLDKVQFGVGYSYGLTNHKLYNDDFEGFAIKSRQDKLSINIGVVFDAF